MYFNVLLTLISKEKAVSLVISITIANRKCLENSTTIKTLGTPRRDRD